MAHSVIQVLHIVSTSRTLRLFPQAIDVLSLIISHSSIDISVCFVHSPWVFFLHLVLALFRIVFFVHF